MKTRRRSDLRRTSVEPVAAANGNDVDGDTVEDVSLEHDPGMNGHEQTEGEAVTQVHSNHVSTPITLPKRRRRLDDTRIVASPPSTVETEAVSRTVIAPRARRTEGKGKSVVTERVVAQESAEPRFTWRSLMTYENLFWVGLFTVAIVSRLWDIGNRGIHHDESLHAVYGNNLYAGRGYTHDPMMHGPLQFHLIAAMYWLFGATDATARLASAFSGIFVVMSPFFLRRQLGRLTALICSFLLLVSPSILYFSRMAREDAIFSGMEMLMLVGLWRFISMRRPADFYIFCAGLALMFTIKESAYLTVAVLAIFFVLLFAYQSGYAILGALGGYLATMGGMYLMVNGGMKNGSIPGLPNIPSVNPGYDMIIGFAVSIFAHPLVQWALIITAIFAGVIITLFRLRARQMVEAGEGLPLPPRRISSALPSRRASPGSADTRVASSNRRSGNGYDNGDVVGDALAVDGSPVDGDRDLAERRITSNEASPLWDPRHLDPKPGTLLSRYEPGSLPHLIGSLFARPVVLLIGFAVAAIIFTTLYTVFFTDTPRGIASGLFASIGYWMAQQGIERGGQPWYYYLLLIPLYEPIAVFFSMAAGAFFSWRGLRKVLATRAERRYEGGTHLGSFNTDRPVPFASFDSFLPLFLGFWLLGVLFLYSWASEKMPWLMVHMVRPAIFLTALFIGALVASLLARRQERIEQAGLLDDGTWAERISARGPVAARGALFSLLGAKEIAWQAGLAPRTLALDTGAGQLDSTVAFSMNGESRSKSAPPPPPVPRRRSGYSAAAAQTAVRAQDPPWVSWSRPNSWVPVALFLSIFTIFTMAWALSMNTLISGSKYNEWAATWMFPLLMLGLLALFIVWVGPGRALRYFALGILTVGLLYQFRSATMLTYHQPDVPKEMAVYVQTSPDVTRVMRELEAYAYVSAGSKRDFKVMYDSFTSWPMEWYLRDYNKQFIAEAKAEPSADQRVLLLEYAQHNSDENLKSNYVAQRYAMRWWFPEDWYKNEFLPPGMNTKTTPFPEQVGGALGTTWGTISKPDLQGTLWKYLMFRELPKPIGSEDMILFVRKDAVQQYHYIQYPPPRSDNLPGPTSPPPVQP